MAHHSNPAAVQAADCFTARAQEATAFWTNITRLVASDTVSVADVWSPGRKRMIWSPHEAHGYKRWLDAVITAYREAGLVPSRRAVAKMLTIAGHTCELDAHLHRLEHLHEDRCGVELLGTNGYWCIGLHEDNSEFRVVEWSLDEMVAAMYQIPEFVSEEGKLAPWLASALRADRYLASLGEGEHEQPELPTY